MRILKLGALVLSIAGLASASSAAPEHWPIQRFGNVFAAAVCGNQSAPGTAHCFAKVVTDARGNIINGKPDLNRNVSPSGYAPADLWSAYGVTPARGNPGTGPTIAIVDAYGYPNAAADLAKYRSQFTLGTCGTSDGCLRIVNQSGGTSLPRTDTGWDQEQALDLDMVSAMCPNCKILLVQASSSSLANLATAVNTAASNGALVISNSYGGSEGGTTSYESSWNHSGTAVTVSTGDNGYGVEFPASSPHVIAVGGTTLSRNGGGWSETAWSGAGSGCSTVYGIYDQDQSVTGCSNRAVADVSAVANPSTGVAVYGPSSRSRSGWMVFGGTSVAAPLIGGVYGAAGASTVVSYPTTKLYQSSAGNFRDVTSGSNGNCGTKLCNATSGWDGPTGLGTPQGYNAF